MKKIETLGPGLLIGIPTLGRPVPLSWAMSFKALNPPINFNVNFQIIHGMPVAEARNAIVHHALDVKAKYLFFLGDDTEVPSHTLRQLLYRIENTPHCGVVGGVYCSKTNPAAPLVFRGNGNGSYWDWKIGEYFEVTGLGNDCTLFRTEIFKEVSEPWFKTVDDDKFLDGINSAEQWTEDLYFFDKLQRETNWKIFCDSFVMCKHWDVYNNKFYELPADSYPLRQKIADGRPKCLVIGEHKYPEDFDCISFGFDKADYRGDALRLPFAEREFDKIVIGEGFSDEVHAELLRVIKENGNIEIKRVKEPNVSSI